MEDEGRIVHWHHRPIMDRTEFIRINREMFGSSSDVLVQRHLQEILSGRYFEKMGWYQKEDTPILSPPAPVTFPQVYVPSSRLFSLGEELYRRLLKEVQQAGGEIFPGAKKNDLDHPFIRGYVWSEHYFTLADKSGAFLQIEGDPKERAKKIKLSCKQMESRSRTHHLAYTEFRTEIDLEKERLNEEKKWKYDTGLEAKLSLPYSREGLSKKITFLFNGITVTYTKVKGRDEYHLTTFPKGLPHVGLVQKIKTNETSLIYSISTSRPFGQEPCYETIFQQIDMGKIIKAMSAIFLRERLV